MMSAVNQYASQSCDVANRQQAGVPNPPRVNVAEWCLGAMTLAVAAVANVQPDYDLLRRLLALLVLINIALLAIAVRQALRTGCIGKVAFILPTVVFFWADAVVLANQDSPFAPNSLDVAGGQFSPSTVAQALMLVALFEMTLLLGYSRRPTAQRVSRWCANRHDLRGRRVHWLLYVLAAVGILPALIADGFNVIKAFEHLVASRSYSSQVEGDGTASLVALATRLSMFASAALFVRAILWSKGRFLVAVVAGAASAPLLLTGARHLILFVAIPALAVALARSASNERSVRAAKLGLMAIGVFAVLQAQLILRPVGFDKFDSVAPSRLLEADVSQQFSALLFATTLVPEEHGYFYEPVEPFFVAHFIPRAAWRGKPEMRTQRYFNDSYSQGKRGSTYTPTIIGQFHMNWGFVGVLIAGAWIGWLAAFADRVFLSLRFERQWAITAAVGMFYAFIVTAFRFYAPFYFAYFAVGLAAAVLLTRRKQTTPGAKMSQEKRGFASV